jgi:hypothetical protein
MTRQATKTGQYIAILEFALVKPHRNGDNHTPMTSFPHNSKNVSGYGIGTKLVQTLFFLFFFGMGAVFTWLVARESVGSLKAWTWSPTACQITRSSVSENDRKGRRTGDFYVDVQFTYNFRGAPFTSDRYQLRPVKFTDYGKAERLAERFRAGSTAVCYVNPSAPSEAVLHRGNLFFPFFILFPLVFVGIGSIGIFSAWRQPAASPILRPISNQTTLRFGPGLAALFFGVFIIIGGLLLYLFSVRPLLNIVSARKWPAIPCTVVSSAVKSHSGDHGTTYSINILYTYVFDDREYKANRYDFMGGSSSGYQSKQAIVSRYTPGSKAVCYVNPRDPVEAVLERGVTPIMWVGLLPLVFVFLGFIGLVSALRKRSNQAGFVTFLQDTRFPANAVLSQLTAAEMSAPVILKPKASPAGKLLATLAIALFWNGIISVFLVQVFKNWRSGHLEWFLVLFLTPFVLIGLGLVVAVFYFLLALFNPRPHLTVSPGVPRLGESLRVEWEVCGRVEALRALRVRLQGREEATYTRGTTTSTDRSVFADLEVAIVTSPQEMRSGSAAVTIPQTLMHSFCGKHNKLLWCVQVHGEIERWPDVREEFPVNVAPAARIGAFPA